MHRSTSLTDRMTLFGTEDIFFFLVKTTNILSYAVYFCSIFIQSFLWTNLWYCLFYKTEGSLGLNLHSTERTSLASPELSWATPHSLRGLVGRTNMSVNPMLSPVVCSNSGDSSGTVID